MRLRAASKARPEDQICGEALRDGQRLECNVAACFYERFAYCARAASIYDELVKPAPMAHWEVWDFSEWSGPAAVALETLGFCFSALCLQFRSVFVERAPCEVFIAWIAKIALQRGLAIKVRCRSQPELLLAIGAARWPVRIGVAHEIALRQTVLISEHDLQSFNEATSGLP